MDETNFAHALLYELDQHFDPETGWSEAYQDMAYDIVQAFRKFEQPALAAEPILQCVERQLTSDPDWFAEFRVFLETLDTELLTTEYVKSLQRRPTSVCKEWLLRLGYSESQIEEIVNIRQQRFATIFTRT
ncbi:hypothetical protein [Saccharibacillus endophyticus]|uniref:CdiI immunity protein domain-containing protein n=1 Tax=Saccharibacillus endophyticus TaxID=2060666 RepID=A0ABQ1ZLA8_9BACL|nr:hypothetical protein [Saccharibacillus endophyticus]GGH68505.1 hypothetical protein GCM10007362_02580 [Saccharibacillus endophyticus]